MIKNRKEQALKNSKLIETSEKLAELNDILIEQNKRLLKKNEVLLDKEKYLLNAMNDSMNVKEPKRFLAHRLSIAPWDPIDYTDEVKSQ